MSTIPDNVSLAGSRHSRSFFYLVTEKMYKNTSASNGPNNASSHFSSYEILLSPLQHVGIKSYVKRSRKSSPPPQTQRHVKQAHAFCLFAIAERDFDEEQRRPTVQAHPTDSINPMHLSSLSFLPTRPKHFPAVENSNSTIVKID